MGWLSNIDWKAQLKVAVVAAAFGAVALAVVEAGLTVKIPGTGVVSDPREVFTTTGAAWTGPVGGVIIGVLAGFREEGIPLASLLAHVSGGLWMGVAYATVVHKRLTFPVAAAGWAALVLIYYFVFAVPGFVIGQSLFYEASFTETYGEGASLLSAYRTLADGAMPEALLTTAVTTLVYIALPRRNRRPLW